MLNSKQAPQAKDFMNSKVHTVTVDMALDELIQFLLKHKISNAPVVEHRDDEQKPILIGFVSEADCLKHLANEMFYGSPAPRLTAGVIMTRHPICVTADTNVFTLASIFVHHRLRHLPVVEGERLIGIVSRRNILHALDSFCREDVEQRLHERFFPDVHELANLRFIMEGQD